MRVLIVDDSVVFRTAISTALSHVPGIEVVGTAAHGRIALQKLEQNSVDVVTLDMEMPEMNGIEVLKEIRKRKFNVRVIIFSSQTQRGAEAALEALREGADDVLAKPSGDGLSFETANASIQATLVPKILQFAGLERPLESKVVSPSVDSSTLNDFKSKILQPEVLPKKDLSKFYPSVLVIGSSTGGPTALEKIFSTLTGPVAIPILIVQHMPPVFTEILARRLGELSGIPSHEAKQGQVLEPNNIYVAPGDHHMLISGTRERAQIVLNQAPQRNSVRPAVDYLFETAAQIYQANCLGVVLTGMGEDGLIGARMVRKNAGAILIQNKESCVVFGMPGAIYESGDFDQMSSLESIMVHLKQVTQENRAAQG